MQLKNLKATQQAPLSLYETYVSLIESYPNLCIIEIEAERFIVKALGRKDYRDVLTNQELDNLLKEEAICELCCLYPENYDFEQADAGIATKLYESIIEFSFFGANQESKRHELMNYFRSEMFELHNQINCMIAEAFPSLEFAQIENFDMITALKYLSRAEWILQNLRGFNMLHDPFTGEAWEPDNLTQEKSQDKTQEQAPAQKPKTSQTQDQGFIPGEDIYARLERLKAGNLKKESLTPEKLRELQSISPDIDWTAKTNISDIEDRDVSSIPVALRTPEELYKNKK